MALSISPDKSAYIVGYATTCDGCSSTAVLFDISEIHQEHAVPLISEVTNIGRWKSLTVASAVNEKGVIVGWDDDGVHAEEPFMLVPQAGQR